MSVGNLRLLPIGIGACLFAACGAGLPPEEDGPPPPQAVGCASSGGPLQFPVSNDGATVYWAGPGVDPTDPTLDQSKIKLVFDIPAGQLPTGIERASIRVGVLPDFIINDPFHVDTVFQILAVDPADLPGFSGSGADTLRLALRYDPVACEIPPEVEATLVLGRLNLTNGAWLEVCGDTADTSLAVREVSCSDGDLSFGVFGVIPRVGDPLNDLTPPVFPTPSFSLALRDRCNTCSPSSVELEWGPAVDIGGSGVIGYWLYVDNVRTAFNSETAANPTVRFVFRSCCEIDTTQSHRYQVTAVDAAGNESIRFGSLTT